jgi:hypothetical protein
VEGGEWLGPLQVGLNVIILLVQAPENVENKGTVLHVLVEVAEIVSHPLHPTPVIVDVQIALHEEPKLCVEVEDARLTVAEELLLEGNPKLLSGRGDGAEQPRQDHVVHLAPMGAVEGRSIGGDVVVEGVALESQQHEVAPTRVLGGRDTEDDGHQGPDVLDADSLSVEVVDGGGLKHASYGGRLPYCWCCNGSSMRWRCSELELKGGRGSLRLKGCEGSDEVGWSSDGT